MSENPNPITTDNLVLILIDHQPWSCFLSRPSANAWADIKARSRGDGSSSAAHRRLADRSVCNPDVGLSLEYLRTPSST